jgi:undecaprenyl-phosphate galactose phosphotransferase
MKCFAAIKRIFDVSLALIGIILLLPLFIIIAIAIKIDSKGPVFFKQQRTGKFGKPFTLYKFRSMVVDNDVHDFSKGDQHTKVGKFLRKTSLDELPQIINILKGDMSFIGNRPYLPREIDDMGLYYYEIIKTTPGLTGYWQVSGRSDTSFKKRLELEKYYSNHASLKMDLKIFFKTFKVVLFGKGAK